jgi:hypothetical protein
MMLVKRVQDEGFSLFVMPAKAGIQRRLTPPAG